MRLTVSDGNENAWILDTGKRCGRKDMTSGSDSDTKLDVGNNARDVVYTELVRDIIPGLCLQRLHSIYRVMDSYCIYCQFFFWN